MSDSPPDPSILDNTAALVGIAVGLVTLGGVVVAGYLRRTSFDLEMSQGISIGNPNGHLSLKIINHGRPLAIRKINIIYHGWPTGMAAGSRLTWNFDPEPPCVVETDRRLEAEMPFRFEDAEAERWQLIIEFENTRQAIVGPSLFNASVICGTVAFRPKWFGLFGNLRAKLSRRSVSG